MFNPVEKTAFAQTGGETGALAVMYIAPDMITWQPLVDYASLTLVVDTPSGSAHTSIFASGNTPTLSVNDLPGDGIYQYELQLTPILDEKIQAAMQNISDDPEARTQMIGDLTAAGVLPSVTSQSGSFSILNGQFVIPVEEKISVTSPSGDSDGGNMINDVVHSDDAIITGSLCIGFDCLTDGSESFGFDTIKFKENNTQIYFDDTSTTAGFPANDWRLIANDSSSGGASYFKIVDSTNSKEPFKIIAGARTMVSYEPRGRIGLGTSNRVRSANVLVDTRIYSWFKIHPAAGVLSWILRNDPILYPDTTGEVSCDSDSPGSHQHPTT